MNYWDDHQEDLSKDRFVILKTLRNKVEFPEENPEGLGENLSYKIRKSIDDFYKNSFRNGEPEFGIKEEEYEELKNDLVEFLESFDDLELKREEDENLYEIEIDRSKNSLRDYIPIPDKVQRIGLNLLRLEGELQGEVMLDENEGLDLGYTESEELEEVSLEDVERVEGSYSLESILESGMETKIPVNSSKFFKG